MSLSTRVIAAVGAVVVIGAGTVVGSVAYASNQGKPEHPLATLVVGRSSIHAGPTCYNDGKPLNKDAIAKCQADAKKAGDAGDLPSSDVTSSDRIGVGVDPGVADKGWWAATDGGQGQAQIASLRTGSTFSGLQTASALLSTSSENTRVTVVENDAKTGDIIAAWFFDLKNKDFVPTAQ
ncbi:hypothetical protein [Saccharothrix sp. ST-888]|uniref:hypothetical protein n=1 Tax=Saccharothrix sp. ST-888 TaxID=1427391 RepID=UPI0006973105|nr:hypothetical protein [Saccharothrix sp. ST-888]